VDAGQAGFLRPRLCATNPFTPAGFPPGGRAIRKLLVLRLTGIFAQGFRLVADVLALTLPVEKSTCFYLSCSVRNIPL
jgi:hypothetical protein